MSSFNAVLHAIVGKVGLDSEEETRAAHEAIDAQFPPVAPAEIAPAETAPAATAPAETPPAA